MKLRGKFISFMRRLVAPLVAEWPLWVLWFVGISIGGVCDIQRLFDIVFPETPQILRLLRIVGYGVCMSALLAYLVAALAHICHTRWVRWPLALVALLATGAYLFIRYHYGTRLTPEIASVIQETYWAEAGEYLGTYIFSMTGLSIILALMVAMAAWCSLDLWWHRHRENHSHHRKMSGWQATLWAVLMLVVIGGAFKMACYGPFADRLTHQSRSHDENFGVDALTNLIKCHHQLQRIDNQTILAITATQHVYDTFPQPIADDSLTIVLVIGDSYIKSHASIYGYDKPTTPIQQRERDASWLIVFNDIVSPYSYTNMAMRSLLSVNDKGSGQQWCDYPLFPAIFKHAGYQVDLWDNQREFMKGSVSTNGLNGLMYHPQVINLCYTNINDRNSEFDWEFVEDYAAHRRDSKHELVLLHLRGQHFKAESRYPHTLQWTHFKPKDYTQHEPPLDDEARQEVADYDNAIRYNDYVLGRIFALFSDRQAVVVCLSDHGGEVHDYHWGLGFRDDNEHLELMLRHHHEIPFVVWCSPRLQQARPQLVERIRQAADRPGTLDNVSQMMLGLSGITTPWYQAERDILSPTYICTNRICDKYEYDLVVDMIYCMSF